MADVLGPLVLRGHALAQIVHEGGEAHDRVFAKPRRLLHAHHHVHAGIDLGMVEGRLRHAEQNIHLGQDDL